MDSSGCLPEKSSTAEFSETTARPDGTLDERPLVVLGWPISPSAIADRDRDEIAVTEMMPIFQRYIICPVGAPSAPA